MSKKHRSLSRDQMQKQKSQNAVDLKSNQRQLALKKAEKKRLIREKQKLESELELISQ